MPLRAWRANDGVAFRALIGQRQVSADVFRRERTRYGFDTAGSYRRSTLSGGSDCSVTGVIISSSRFSFLSFQARTSCFTFHLILDA